MQKYIDPRECSNLPFTPPVPCKLSSLAIPDAQAEYGYRRISPEQQGTWLLQPLYAGLYRVVINTAKRSMFNSVGIAQPESTSGLYNKQIDDLCDMFPNTWVDCMIRVIRTGDKDMSFGQGSIVVLDAWWPEMPLWKRLGKIASEVGELGICRPLPTRTIVCAPRFPSHIAIPLWAALHEVNNRWHQRLGQYYGGIVAKKYDSMYTPKTDGMVAGTWISHPFLNTTVNRYFEHHQRSKANAIEV